MDAGHFFFGKMVVLCDEGHIRSEFSAVADGDLDDSRLRLMAFTEPLGVNCTAVTNSANITLLPVQVESNHTRELTVNGVTVVSPAMGCD